MYIRFLRAEFTEEASGKVVLLVEPVHGLPAPHQLALRSAKHEDIGDFYRPAGLLHFVNTQLPAQHFHTIQIRSPYKKIFQLKVSRNINPVPFVSLFHLPFNRSEAFSRIVRTAQPFIGTPLIWGHNRGRGDQGFDPFTFVFYVYKKALGLPISEVAQLQRMGKPINKQSEPMVPGDLLIFAEGRHLGIFTGAGQYLSAGGGSGKVSYLDLRKSRYHLGNLTMIRRLV